MCSHCKRIKSTMSIFMGNILAEHPGISTAEAIQATLHITAQHPLLTDGYCTCLEAENDTEWYARLQGMGVVLSEVPEHLMEHFSDFFGD